jgi:hypothetical protein
MKQIQESNGKPKKSRTSLEYSTWNKISQNDVLRDFAKCPRSTHHVVVLALLPFTSAPCIFRFQLSQTVLEFIKVVSMAMLEPPQDILQLLRDSLEGGGDSDNADIIMSDDDGTEEILTYIAFLAAGLADAQQFDATVWQDALEPYLSTLKLPADLESFRQATERMTLGADDEESYGDDDDDAEEICDIRFNLAYGGKILLHQTKLRLLRGHRYGLVGQNGRYVRET